MPNPYLVRLREQHDALRSSIEGLQTRAAEGNRDLSEDELRSVTDQAAQLKALADQIEQLTEVEVRSRKVGELAASLGTDDGDGSEQHRSRVTTRDRDPGHYRSVAEGGEHSFFGDMFRSKANGDREAEQRLGEHMRAVTVGSGGQGVVPPKWLMDEYQSLARQGRVVADRVRRLPLGSDPRAITLPKQTAGTDQNLTTQTTEGANNAGWGADRFATGKDTLTPEADSAYQDVSRQLLNSSSPAADVLIMGDLRGAWDTKIENAVCAAILANGTPFTPEVALTDTPNASPTFKGAVPIDAVIEAQVAVSEDLRGPADLAIMTYARFGKFRKLRDDANRPLMPVSRYGPQNANGALGNTLVGDIEGVDAYGTNGVTWTSGSDEEFAVLRSQAVILGESDILEFTYDQVVGPSAVRMGIWGYFGVLVRNPGSVQVITIDRTA